MSIMEKGGKAVDELDQRVPVAGFAKRNLRKVFPDHWTFMFGEIALYSFIVLLLSGIYLTLWFKPSLQEVIYNGSYVPLKGVEMSEAFASTLHISFDVRGGLLMRQIHHWAALLFVASMTIHMIRVFFTGAYRKPREINWTIGILLLTLGILEGFAGYSLPDDLLSGTGLRIAEGIVLSIPVVGTYIQFFMFGGEYPGTDFIPRLYGIHILLIPGIILALITAHLMIVWFQKHTQFPGKGRTNDNVVGYPFMPIYMAKAGAFFFIVFGILVLVSSLVTINAVWQYGPYLPDQITAGSQPDWYMGWLEGALRAMPDWETVLWGHSISWNVLIPGVAVLGACVTILALYPMIERKASGDDRVHNLLDRPRNAPTRTGLGVMGLTFYLVLLIGGGNDLIAHAFDLSLNAITWFVRIGLFVLPPLAFIITKRICLGLQRRDRERLLHGHETGSIMRLPHGEFVEIHSPISEDEKARILSKREVDYEPLPWPEKTDADGVKRPGYGKEKLAARLSRFFYRDRVPLPTPEEIEAAEAHIRHAAAEGEEVMRHHAQLEAEGGIYVDPSKLKDGHK